MLSTTAPSRSAPSAPRHRDAGAPHASQRAPFRAPAPAAAPLRVVTEAELLELRRRTRARRLLALAGAFVALGLFGVVIAHVMLMQGQFELQRLQEQSAASRADYDRLRLQVSELESPDRVIAVAQQKLGMVAPPNITYLAPSADPAAVPATGSSAKTDTARTAAAPPDRWSSVKSHLAEG